MGPFSQMTPIRKFSAAVDANEYESIKQENWKTMNNPVAFSNGKFTVFSLKDTKERKFVPFEVKNETIKSSLYVVGLNLFESFVPTGGLYQFGLLGVGLSYSYRVFNYMSRAVTQIDLYEDGKRVDFTLGRFTGKVVTVNIKDIKKQESERQFVETWEEQCLFPIQVGTQTYYLNGQGQESIKHGEALRAIVNGQSIKN